MNIKVVDSFSWNLLTDCFTVDWLLKKLQTAKDNNPDKELYIRDSSPYEPLGIDIFYFES